MSGANTIQNLIAGTPSSTPTPTEQAQPQQQTQPQQQQQQSQNPPATPNTVQSHSNNTPRFSDDTGGQGGDNNTVQSIMEQVLSGSQQEEGRPTVSGQQTQQQQQQPQQRQQQQDGGTGNNDNSPNSQAHQIVDNFLRINNIEGNFLEGIEPDQLAERVGRGDITALTEALSTTADNAFKQAMATMVQMLPSFAEQIRSDVRAEFGTLSRGENNWSDFAREYPELGKYEKTIRPALEQAIKSANGDIASAHAAIAQIYSGLRAPTEDTTTTGGRGKQQQDTGGFDLSKYLGAEN